MLILDPNEKFSEIVHKKDDPKNFFKQKNPKSLAKTLYGSNFFAGTLL
jgi:hypothetical protein